MYKIYINETPLILTTADAIKEYGPVSEKILITDIVTTTAHAPKNAAGRRTLIRFVFIFERSIFSLTPQITVGHQCPG